MNFRCVGGGNREMRHAAGDCVRPQCAGSLGVGRGRRVLREAAHGAGVIVSTPVLLFRVVGVAFHRNQVAKQQERAEPQGPRSLRHASRHNGSGPKPRGGSTFGIARGMGVGDTHGNVEV